MQERDSSRFTLAQPLDSVIPASTRVLCIDEDPFSRNSFLDSIRTLPISVEFADSAWRAIVMAQEHAYPIVVTATRLSGIDGNALVERMMGIRPATAFVLATREDSVSLRSNTQTDGAIAGLVRKPFYTAELETVLSQAFELHLRRRHTAETQKQKQSRSILLVEDNPGDADLIREYIDVPSTQDIVHVPDLAQAQQLLRERSFDVIITDLTLPDALGLDTVVRLQSLAPEIPLLVSSGIGDETLALRALQLGAQDVLFKGDLTARNLSRAVDFAIERKAAQLRLLRLAHFDNLTGVANRGTFELQVERALIQSKRGNHPFGVLLIDLDNFKQINDRFGHSVGDAFLQEAAARIARTVRESDTVARYGGDEFAVLVTDLFDERWFDSIVRRLNQALAEPVDIGGNSLEMSASIGGTIARGSKSTVQHLIKQADDLMYGCKQSGGKGFRLSSGYRSEEPTYPSNQRRDSSLPPIGSPLDYGVQVVTGAATGALSD